jgi:hypothetical protein
VRFETRSSLFTRALAGVLVAGALVAGALTLPAEQPSAHAGQVLLASSRANGEVARLYHTAFSRQPDAGGFEYWIGQRLSGRPLTAIALEFARSKEFLGRYGHLGDQEFVQQMYQNVMGRKADSGGLEYWTSRLEGGNTRGWVMVGFSESAEFVELFGSLTGSQNPTASGGGSSPTPSSGGLASLSSVVYDMYGAPLKTDGQAWGAHEALPIGLPSHFDFYRGARGGLWDGTQGTGRAVSAWGQLFEAEPGARTHDVRLQVRNHRMYFLLNDGRWVQLRSHLTDPAMEGAWWDGNFQSQGTSPVRSESNNGGGFSVALGPLSQSQNATWHFWWNGWYPREVIPSNAVGVLAIAEMRLIPDTNPGVDMSGARFIASVGVDNYSSPTYTSGGEAISSVMQPRMKYVTTQWNSFSGTNLTEAQLRANPPPVS